MKADPAEFLSRVTKTRGCWLWTGCANPVNGYASVAWGLGLKKKTYVHRISHELFVGPIPPGLTIDHLCRNRLCVNPKHLEAVTRAENILRGNGCFALNARKTKCLRGHPLVADNLIRRPGVERACRKCNSIRCAEYRARVKSKQKRKCP